MAAASGLGEPAGPGGFWTEAQKTELDAILREHWRYEAPEEPEHNNIDGTVGDDRLSGTSGNDRLHGGAGDDDLLGGAGNDVYLFNLGDGNDWLEDYDQGTSKRNIIRFGEGIAPGDIKLSMWECTEGSMSLTFAVGNGGDKLHVYNAIKMGEANQDNEYSIQAVEFADGTVWEWADLCRQAISVWEYGFADVAGSVIHGDVSNDLLVGNIGNDTLSGGAGDDDLLGGAGDDVYLFNLGDGNDWLEDYDQGTSKRNIIRFGEGIAPGDIKLSMWECTEGSMSLTFEVGNDGDKLHVYNAIKMGEANQDNEYSIQAVEFADGTVWEWDDLCRQPIMVHGYSVNAS